MDVEEWRPGCLDAQVPQATILLVGISLIICCGEIEGLDERTQTLTENRQLLRTVLQPTGSSSCVSVCRWVRIGG
jgi:tRNA G37 N-methylase TrmD